MSRYADAWVHVCMYARMHVCMYACMHVCMYACRSQSPQSPAIHCCMWYPRSSGQPCVQCMHVHTQSTCVQCMHVHRHSTCVQCVCTCIGTALCTMYALIHTSFFIRSMSTCTRVQCMHICVALTPSLHRRPCQGSSSGRCPVDPVGARASLACACMCTHHVHVHVCICTPCMHMCVRACMPPACRSESFSTLRMHVCARVYMHAYVCIHACACTRTCTYMHVPMHACGGGCSQLKQSGVP